MITLPLKQLWSYRFVKQKYSQISVIISHSVESHKSTTHVGAII